MSKKLKKLSNYEKERNDKMLKDFEERYKEVKFSHYGYDSQVCPYCKNNEVLEIYRGSDGFFSSKEFSHYECSNCKRKFEYKETLRTIPRGFVRDVLDLALRGIINEDRLRLELKKVGAYI